MPQNTYPYVSAFFLYLRRCLILMSAHLIVMKLTLNDMWNCKLFIFSVLKCEWLFSCVCCVHSRVFEKKADEEIIRLIFVRHVEWSGKRDSNPRPPAWEASALPTELLPHEELYLSLSC